ncbi:alpha beta-hydrolase [Collybia nuda]|uniref:Alpha beta-hydrolase n=1 Tax=Collybia nuda TaxID=64659 RepID=A0A9P5Y9P3_9AGAR|nr:alpha beta-hydrolase [Collybia nuda]
MLMSPNTNTTVKLPQSKDGVTIYAEAVGDSLKPSIVFLHGFALSSSVFDGLFKNAQLLEKFYLVRYDMRGHGRSGKPNTPAAHTSDLYAADFAVVSQAFSLTRPVFVGWSLGSAVITDICANLHPLPIAGAVALGGSPGISGEIVPTIASPILLSTLPQFNDNTDVSKALTARVEFVDALFNEPENVPASLKYRYLGETVVQTPDVSTSLSIRPQDPSKLFAAGAQGLPLQLLFGKRDKLVLGEGVLKLVQPHFKDLTLSFIDGGHALFDDNEKGLVEELSKFVLRVTARK